MDGEYVFLQPADVCGNEVMIIPPTVTKIKKNKLPKILKTIGKLMMNKILPIMWQ